MRKIVIDKRYKQFVVSPQAFIRLREFLRVKALEATDRGLH